MNKSILTITTLLALGTVGCAGAGTQYSATSPTREVASVQYESRGLGSLWESSSAKPEGLSQSVAVENGGSDLWTPASVAQTWDATGTKADPKAVFSTTTTKLKF